MEAAIFAKRTTTFPSPGFFSRHNIQSFKDVRDLVKAILDYVKFILCAMLLKHSTDCSQSLSNSQ